MKIRSHKREAALKCHKAAVFKSGRRGFRGIFCFWRGAGSGWAGKGAYGA